MNSRKMGGSLGLLAALLVGCGSMSNGTPNPGGNTEGMSKQDAVALKAALLSGNKYLARSLSAPQGLSSLSASESGLSEQALNCSSSKTPQAPVDADGDTVPASVVFAVDCTLSSDTNPSSSSLKGGVTVKDKDDNNPKSGYTVDTNQYVLKSVDAQGRSSELALDLDTDLTLQNTQYALNYNFNFAANGTEGTFRVTNTFQASYRPDSLETPFNAGSLSYDGTASLSSGGKNYALTAKVQDLHYSKTCGESAFDAGSARYSDSKGNTLSFAFSGCNSVTVTYNAEKI